MALFDFITGIKDKLPQYGNIAAELQAPQAVSGGGELAVQPLKPTLFNRITGLGDKIYGGLFGKIVDNSGVNDGTLSATVNNPHREGGIFADLQSGFNENLNNRFQPQNLAGNGGSLARRIGEGFGTAMRFADSPLGRGLLVGGAIGALGGTPAEMAAYGLGTTALNQGNRTADRLYRDNLIKSAQQSLSYSPEFNSLSADEIATIKQGVEMGADYKTATPEQQQAMLQNAASEYLRNRQAEQLQNITNQVGSIRGYVTPEVYKNLIASQQLQDNARYRNMYLDSQIANQKALQQIRQDQLDFQKSKEDFDRQIALGNLGIAQSKLEIEGAKLRHELENPNLKNLTTGGAENLSGTYQGIGEMQGLKQIIKDLPNRITTPGIAQISSLNPWDTDAQAFNQYVKTYKQVIGKGLEGGVLRKEDEYKYDQIIPKMGDTKEVLRKKANQLQEMLENKYKTDLDFYSRAGYNTGSFPKINNNSGINIDMDAINAELSRRGL